MDFQGITRNLSHTYRPKSSSLIYGESWISSVAPMPSRIPRSDVDHTWRYQKTNKGQWASLDAEIQHRSVCYLVSSLRCRICRSIRQWSWVSPDFDGTKKYPCLQNKRLLLSEAVSCHVSVSFSPQARIMLSPVVGSRIVSFLSRSLSEGEVEGCTGIFICFRRHSSRWDKLISSILKISSAGASRSCFCISIIHWSK
jgi:hypothetical protein